MEMKRVTTSLRRLIRLRQLRLESKKRLPLMLFFRRVASAWVPSLAASPTWQLLLLGSFSHLILIQTLILFGFAFPA